MTLVCPACGGRLEVWKAVGDKLAATGQFPMDRCLDCRSLILHSRLRDQELSAFYPADYWYQESDATRLSRLEWRYRRWVLKDHVRFVTDFLPRPARVLDVGCSSGTFLFLLKERGHEVLGLDFSESAAQEAGRRYGVTVRVGSLQQQAAELQRWAPEAVCMFHVLEHLPDPLAALHQVRSILGPRGQLFLQVPNMDSWQAKIFGTRWYGMDVPRHAVNFTFRGLQRVMERAGFQTKNWKRFSLRDNSPSWASSLFLSVDPLKRRLSGSPSSTANVFYAALVAGFQPLAALEAACGYGGTLFVRAVAAEEP